MMPSLPKICVIPPLFTSARQAADKKVFAWFASFAVRKADGSASRPYLLCFLRLFAADQIRAHLCLSVAKNQKAGDVFSGFLLKDWRQPTLAEAIQPLPSARLCLTAEFGMGSGRTTALWPPN